MSSTSVPQLFLSAASPYAQPGSIDSGFRSPLAWMTKSAPVATQGYYYPLVGKKFWVLGSSSDCNIVFSNDYISSHHALLLATADRAIYFCDLQSVNGSFVNEAQVFVPTLLKHGDLLRIGPLEIEFQHTSEFPVGHTPVPARVVLLLQPSEAQAAI
ncbi:MAG TPA: FHA domain-containing protein, partial [Stenomitos sp.]